MEGNKVSVKIYGQDYVIAGEKPREHIIKVADYVNTKMHEIERAVKGGGVSSLAVLSAVNAADEYFTAMSEIAEVKEKNAQLLKEVQQTVQMWEEAKRSFVQYKEGMQDITKQKEELTKKLLEKDEEIARMVNALSEAEEKFKEKLSEIENNFFDLQMENVQLKSELERFKKVMV